MSHHHTHFDHVFEACAQELESLGPNTPDGAASLGIGSLLGAWPLVQKLITALKAKDFTAIATSVRDLLNLFLGSDNGGDLVFNQAVAGDPANGQFLKIIGGVLIKLLPLILGVA